MKLVNQSFVVKLGYILFLTFSMSACFSNDKRAIEIGDKDNGSDDQSVIDGPSPLPFEGDEQQPTPDPQSKNIDALIDVSLGGAQQPVVPQPDTSGGLLNGSIDLNFGSGTNGGGTAIPQPAVVFDGTKDIAPAGIKIVNI